MSTETQDGPSAAAPQKAFGPNYKWFVLALLFIVYIFNFLDRQIFVILQESIREELHLSDTQLGLLGGFAFAIFYTTLGIPVARLADRSNRARIIAVALAIWSGMTALCGLAVSFWTLALARIGVGVGEAGCSPPAHSLIADYFAPKERATALGIYAMGIPIGTAMGLLLGGTINDLFGWREAFFVVGLPGILFALIVWFFLREPLSDAARRQNAAAHHMPLTEVARYLWSRRTFRHMAFASSLHAFVGYGVGQFMPSFYIRSFQVSTTELSLYLGLIALTFGAVSTLAGGWLTDRLIKRDQRWYCWVPAITILAAMPFSILLLLQEQFLAAIIISFVPALLGNMYLGPTFAVTQGLATPAMRAVAAAVLLFVLNLIGLGLGPVLIGMLSDYLKPAYGAADGLKYALLLGGLVNAWSAAHYFWASRTVRAELAAATKA